MLFNSYAYLLAFLPASLLAAWLFGMMSRKARLMALAACSLVFYAWWRPGDLPLLLLSVTFNYGLSLALLARPSRAWLAAGVLFNLGLLGWYKYAGFVAANLVALGVDLPIPDPHLPLAISFFTFQQVAFLVDCHVGRGRRYAPIDYLLFVTFWPQFIAGPIVHHSEMMPQFQAPRPRSQRDVMRARGLFLLSLGLFKKVVIADSFAAWASAGYDNVLGLDTADAWLTTLSYTLQLYYDFSGYTDMAIGSALLLGIRLPWNFNSPYQATSIGDFWRRWHMTLGRWLRDYVYIPLGGNRHGLVRTCAALLATFVVGGIWHGAAWTFVAWGLMHGMALVVQRLWAASGRRLSPVAAWALTFGLVHLAWVPFRAETFSDATDMLLALGGQAMAGDSGDSGGGVIDWRWALPWVACGLAVAWCCPNSNQLAKRLKRTPMTAFATILMFAIAMVKMGMNDDFSEFLYFNF